MTCPTTSPCCTTRWTNPATPCWSPTGGEAALTRAAQAQPDIVLLDAMMPGMDGFEVARRLKASPITAHIPIIFMTGLTETEHLVAALEAGGVDYVTKPIKPREVMARMAVHLGSARRARQEAQQAGQARNALDAFGYASITVRAHDGRLIWQTPLARQLLQSWFGDTLGHAPEAVQTWLRRVVQSSPVLAPNTEPPRLSLEQGARRMTFRLHQQAGDSAGGGDWLIVMREVSGRAGHRIHELGLQAHRARGRGAVLGGERQDQPRHRRHLGSQPGHRQKNTWNGCSPSWA